MYNFISKEILSKIKNKTIRLIASSFIILVVLVIILYTTFFATSNIINQLVSNGQSTNIKIGSNKKFVTEKNIIERRYAGCDIKGNSGKDIISNIEINAPKGFSILKYEEVSKEKDKNIVKRRSNLLNPTIILGNKFIAKCYGDGKVVKYLGIVVDHKNAWRYSDIILTLKKN